VEEEEEEKSLFHKWCFKVKDISTIKQFFSFYS